MECLQIDWKNIDGTFEKDDFYENIQAPKWIDFTVPVQPVDDHAWFCGKAGCTHEIKTVLQALNQGNANPFETCMKSSMDPSTAKAQALSAGVAVKKTRPVVSSSLSSLSELKAAYAKNKALHHKQMPSISESKAQATKNNRQQQASENENPNRACKLQDGACKKPTVRALEGTARHMKVSETKRIIGKEATTPVSNTDSSFCSVKTSVSLSRTGPLMEASKSVFIFGNRDPMHAKSTLNKAVDKDPLSNSNNITEAKIKKAGGETRFFSRPSPTARNPYLSASLATPIVRRSAANARPLHGVYLGNDKVLECKPPRVTRDVRVTVQANACRKKTDHKKEDNKSKLPPQLERNDRPEIGSKDSSVVKPHNASMEEQLTQADSKEGESILDTDSSAAPITQDKQLPHPSQGVVEERKSADIQTRDKEDSITNTLEKFLENLQISSHNDEVVSNEEDSESREKLPCTEFVESAKKQEMVNPRHQEIVTEQEASMQTHQDMDDDILKDEAVTSNHAAKQIASEHDRKEDAMEKVARCSLDSSQLSQISEPLSCKDESNPSSAASHVSSDDGGSAKDEVLSLDNDDRPKKIQQKQSTKDWQKCRGTKRKSSELNLNCSSKNDKHGTQKLKQSSTTAKLSMISASQRPGLQQDSGEEQHKKLKTTTQAFKPFRFRTEERGALKELGLGKKEPGSPKSKDTVHHALRMPSFGRPFRPQRSTKKLTIPKEPKFHVSRTKNTCTTTSLATDLPS